MVKSIVSKPPERSGVYSTVSRGHNSVFLAGSIEMGTAADWQQQVIDMFPEGITFLNPRRDDWDSSWEQSIDNPQFNAQVTWELENLEATDFIFFYFDPNTKSPISLLELGMHITSRDVIVCCPSGFYRKGNVDIVCHRYGVHVFDKLEDAIRSLGYQAL